MEVMEVLYCRFSEPTGLNRRVDDPNQACFKTTLEIPFFLQYSDIFMGEFTRLIF
jgi:hypothetical protein